MENQRNLLFIGLMTISVVLYLKWLEFSKQPVEESTVVVQNESLPSLPSPSSTTGLPNTPAVTGEEASMATAMVAEATSGGTLITVETDLVNATINTLGGTIERLELKQEPASTETPGQGFILLKNEVEEQYVVEDGLQTANGDGPTHRDVYGHSQTEYKLNGQDSLTVPLTFTSSTGVEFVKNITFRKDSYVVDIDYQIKNASALPWRGFLYGQFRRTEPVSSGGGFGQLPSYTGGVYYTEEDKYTKYDFGDMQDEALAKPVTKSWVAMLQHYFVGAFLPADTPKRLYSIAGKEANPIYRFGYIEIKPTEVSANGLTQASTQIFIGPKTQSRLKLIEKEQGFTGLARTVDYGWLTFIADPLFWLLDKINGFVGNWGWSIIFLTILIKGVFYPLSDKAGKSSAAMKKVQPRLQTLKERYKDDRQKFQMEMMALYKEEKINPAGGCLPILVQMPVFLALYWVLLESVELRQAPFALWLQDLSAPDPFFILPVLMGVTQFIMFRLNPMPMDDIQKKVFMIMPIVFIFIFAGFPQGLVLYWVVNNILSMAQQWYINRKYAV
ncbi:MAG: membrane protein insertase YidC [Gammaproteobacteria bacterium]|nr:membrane protein insertase YidC [Gammaproteobacteria bacterium]